MVSPNERRKAELEALRNREAIMVSHYRDKLNRLTLRLLSAQTQEDKEVILFHKGSVEASLDHYQNLLYSYEIQLEEFNT